MPILVSCSMSLTVLRSVLPLLIQLSFRIIHYMDYMSYNFILVEYYFRSTLGSTGHALFANADAATTVVFMQAAVPRGGRRRAGRGRGNGPIPYSARRSRNFAPNNEYNKPVSLGERRAGPRRADCGGAPARDPIRY
ncbi:hypothetical protein EVAR_87242_1 [Eumeta japonica]|uniref:Uncharacterized protein n=1 Tax=Eumeta variegata TaxID=151549 RepID=A0A4C1YR92_EUMVA|nr:hypothetical protein EVAR_87242_1 [Eumeta japonica]